MSAHKNGGPAFPSPAFAIPKGLSDSGVILLQNAQGMSLRDYLFARILPTMIDAHLSALASDPRYGKITAGIDWQREVVKGAWSMADLSIEMREGGGQ